ncbi:Rib/alpha-like domain-containing protein, partial [Corynebacterium sp. HMSC29G08]|uniref:Rib/alpha-like domain-containing protein n=1 Tax=Corynebacterium sp. HMSC29G08 TaxID=1581069 RepID=UPI000AD0E57B
PDKPVDLPNKGGPVKPGTTVETNGPGTAELKPNGTITVTPEGAKPGDEIVVTVKDKDDKVIDEVTVKITEPSKTIADQTDPDWKDKETTPGTPVEVPNEGDKLPEGSKVEVPEGADGWKVEVGSDGSTIVVTPPADAAPGAKLDVPVKVTYPDNSVDTDDFTVTVKDPNAGEKNPDWDDTTTEPDKP